MGSSPKSIIHKVEIALKLRVVNSRYADPIMRVYGLKQHLRRKWSLEAIRKRKIVSQYQICCAYFRRGQTAQAVEIFKETFASNDFSKRNLQDYHFLQSFQYYLEYARDCNSEKEAFNFMANLLAPHLEKTEVRRFYFYLCWNFGELDSLLGLSRTLEQELLDCATPEEFLSLMDDIDLLASTLGAYNKSIQSVSIAALLRDNYYRHKRKSFDSVIFSQVINLLLELGENRIVLEMVDAAIEKEIIATDMPKIAAILMKKRKLYTVDTAATYEKGVSLLGIHLQNVAGSANGSELYTIKEYMPLLNTGKVAEASQVLETNLARAVKNYRKSPSGKSAQKLLSLLQMKLRNESFEDVNHFNKVTKALLRHLATARRHLTHEQRAIGYASIGQYKTAKMHFMRCTQIFPHSRHFFKLFECESRLGKFEDAASCLNRAIKLLCQERMFQTSFSAADYKKLSSYFSRQAKNNFYARSSEILDAVPQPTSPKGIVFLSNLQCQNSLAMFALPLHNLRQQGYAVVPLSSGGIFTQPSGLPEVDRMMNILNQSYLRGHVANKRMLLNDWEIDWDNRKVICNEVNYYQAIYEALSIELRRFTIDVKIPYANEIFLERLAQVDRCVYVCERIRQRVAPLGLPIRFVSANAHVAPFAAFRAYCEHYGRDANMHFINVNPAYENYYNNLSGKYSTAIGISNATCYPDLRSPFLARKDLFEKWLQAGNTAEMYRGEIDEWLNKNRVSSQGMCEEAALVKKRLEAHKASGGKIICIFGKITCDLAVPYDGGPAHRDFKDWLNHTVASARGSNNIVLIKPHPHELRSEIAKRLSEYMVDLIEEELPSNVIFLGHRWFNNQDLMPLLDLGVLWNGTSSLELGANGVPVVMCSHFGKHDYPVDFTYPKDRDDYEDIIHNPTRVTIAANHPENCALLLKYMATDEVAVPLRYSRRPATNDPVGAPKWYEDEVQAYLKNGDPYVERLANRFFND